MNDEDWTNGFVRCLGVRLAGDLIGDVDEHGERIVGDTMLLLLNAHHEPIPFCLPLTNVDQYWECVVDTADGSKAGRKLNGDDVFQLAARSMAVFRTQTADRASSEFITAAQAQAMARRRRPTST
jgi:glycogen operon protein